MLAKAEQAAVLQGQRMGLGNQGPITLGRYTQRCSFGYLPTWPRAFSPTSPPHTLRLDENNYRTRKQIGFRKVEKGATADVSPYGSPVFPAIMLAFTKAPLFGVWQSTTGTSLPDSLPPDLATPSSNGAYQGLR